MKIPDEIVREAWDKYCEGARDGFAMRAALQVAVDYALEEAAKEIAVLAIAEGDDYIRAIHEAQDEIRKLAEPTKK